MQSLPLKVVIIANSYPAIDHLVCILSGVEMPTETLQVLSCAGMSEIIAIQYVAKSVSPSLFPLAERLSRAANRALTCTPLE